MNEIKGKKIANNSKQNKRKTYSFCLMGKPLGVIFCGFVFVINQIKAIEDRKSTITAEGALQIQSLYTGF